MKGLFSLCLLFIWGLGFSQTHLNKIKANDPNLPNWAVLMYSDQPNFNEVVEKYQHYFTEHPFEKTVHTQYFKRWVNSVKHNVDETGAISPRSASQNAHLQNEIQTNQTSDRGGEIWHYAGPQHHVDSDGSMTPGFRHSNIYCHDRATNNSNLLFCGTESGGVYKTIDAGLHWTFVTKSYLIGTVSAIRIKPTDENFIIFSAENDLWRSTDGGFTWTVIGQPSFVSQNISAWEITYSPFDNNIIYAATNQGFFRSTDGGNNWTEVLTEACETVAIKPNDPSVVYTIQYNPSLDYSQFYKSTDYGASFQLITNGWFDAGLGNIQILGGRLAVTDADPERIYGLLVGYENAGSAVTTSGWVGTWVSYDSGASWQFPHGLIGTPYTASHPNLMNFNADDGTYSQIHYNTTMAVSQLDPDKVLIGGLNLWVSHDACATYEGVGGYIGGIDYFHVDQQEYRIYKTSPTTEEIWFSNDGGIGHSTDFMATHDNLNRGIDAVNLWGYDQGWSEDIMVGGRYHNGNMAYHENYPTGEFLALGGGEAATGYVNYTDQNETFFSDIGGKVLPESLSGTPTNQSLSMSPNESYWNNGSSRIMFDNSYFNIAWLGNQNTLYRSTDGGSSYEPIHVFGTNPDNDVLWIEQSYSNQDFMYLHQAVGNSSVMWKSIDHGATWTSMNIPLNLRNMNFTLSGDDEYTLWVSYFDGQNGQKVYKTTNGGVSWTNLTTTMLNGQEPWAMCHQYGTNGGVYLAMLNGLVYYRNNDMADWASYSFGLPASSQPLRIVPFYKGGVIRLATWNLGVWEAPLYESSAMIADFAAEFNTFFCPGNPVHFVDHSVASPNATYQWSFPGATPASSIEKNPVVSYATEGTYDATLTVTDNGNSQTVTKTAYIQSLQGSSSSLTEDFESGSFPLNWQRVGNGSWVVNDAASAYGVGTHSIRFDNYYYDAQGERDEFWTDKITALPQTTITFDAAYAQYNSGYSDTLAVLVSFNCGADWNEVFVRGGTALGNATPTTNYYTPAAAEWVNYSALIPDAPTAGMDMIVAFQNRGHYGNPIYVDNINIVSTSSVEDESMKPQLLVYPNPTSDLLNISGSMLSETMSQLRVYNSVGQLILEEKIRVAGVRMEKRLDTSNWPAGQYTVQFINGDQCLQVSVIKK